MFCKTARILAVMQASITTDILVPGMVSFRVAQSTCVNSACVVHNLNEPGSGTQLLQVSPRAGKK